MMFGAAATKVAAAPGVSRVLSRVGFLRYLRFSKVCRQSLTPSMALSVHRSAPT